MERLEDSIRSLEDRLVQDEAPGDAAPSAPTAGKPAGSLVETTGAPTPGTPLPSTIPPVPPLESIQEAGATSAESIPGLVAETGIHTRIEPGRDGEAGRPPISHTSAGTTPDPESAPKPTSARRAEALEVELGTVWLVRIAVVVLLTGLVFLGNYTYRNYIGRLGPVGRLTLLYLAGGILCAAGAWVERGKETVRNYARVLMGGGVAILYYATYAAYFVPRLHVISDPIVAGGLLLALSGGIVWLADRKRSEPMAACAILLSYYAGTINPIGIFTLFSDAILTVAAVAFLIRRQWTTLSFLSLAGSYVSFGFWRYFHSGHLPWDCLGGSEFAPGVLILSCYWLLFTAGLFLCAQFPPGRRMAFLSLNNGAYFALATALIRGAHPSVYWTFPCGLGVLCLALAYGAQLRMRDELLADGAYFAQGLMLLTFGIACKLSSYQLSLALALQGAVLMACCRERHAVIYKAAAALVSFIAFGIAASRVLGHEWLATPLAGLLALVFLFDARWAKRLYQAAHGTSAPPGFQLFPAYFVGMAVSLGGLAGEDAVPMVWHYPAFAFAAAFLAYTRSLHGLIELSVLGQIYLLDACISWVSREPWFGPRLPGWNPALVVLATVLMVHWWRGRMIALPVLGAFGQTLCTLGMVAILNRWLMVSFAPDHLLIALPLVAILMLGYGTVTRVLPLKLACQIFIVIGVIRYLDLLGMPTRPPAGLALLAFLLLFLNGFLMRRAFENTIWPDGSPALEPGGYSLVEGYRFLAMVLYVAWGFAYVPAGWLFAFFSFSALGLFGAGVWSHRPWRIRRCGLLLLLAVGVFWFGDHAQVSWLNAVSMLVLLAAYHIAKRPALNWPGLPKPWRDGIAYVLLATLWLLGTRWVQTGGQDFLTTVAWSMLAGAIMGAGFLWRDRSHVRAGMALFGLALGRIVLVDVWDLEMGYRIASFLVLGVVLLLLGFVYNRFADRIRNLE